MSTFVPEDYVSVPKAKWDEQVAEIERLRARIVELEATIAATSGTLSQTQAQGPEVFGVTYGVTPNTPR